MVARVQPDDESIEMLDRREWLTLVDRAARRALGISGDEFISRWEAGEYSDPDRDPEVMRIVMLLPSGR
ncbi:MAG: hypothetical protein AB7R89_04030 [Dehalococcoidia bacterium]